MNFLDITIITLPHTDTFKLYKHNFNCKVLTKRDELSFFTVLALPNASRIGLACNNCCSSSPYKITE